MVLGPRTIGKTEMEQIVKVRPSSLAGIEAFGTPVSYGLLAC